MPITKSVIVAIVFILSAGCTMQNVREGIYTGMYEGSRIENQRGTTPAERAGKPDPDYNQYSKERKQRIENDTR